ncbi:hypothetical protein DVR12_17090 [Chitinophaga silvatica]|uniref:PE-PGRS family protein n=2 Tax=Chitinophaga silvatica TaxID=2282649 RepID=A0A3E1Y7N3_9BACT|nr:hypothetical protein DVR12_17090 [Chitinophaga silvatica]
MLIGEVAAQTTNPQILGYLNSKHIREASGIASSIPLKNCYWTHNDSGNDPEVFLLDDQAKLIATVYLTNASNRDWEDIAEGIGPQKGKHYVYVGDIGDNFAIRKHIKIYRFPEPNKIEPYTKIKMKADELKLQYPDGAKDAESLMIDPISKQIYIVSKREKEVTLYKTKKLLFKDGDTATLQPLIRLPYTWVTAGDISKDGHHIVIKTLTHVYYWHRETGESVEAAMKKPAKELPYLVEKQGEGISILPNNDGYVTISEGKGAPLYYYKWKF